jgi:crotonobetainyl-CoA:carnitine CoA-transferase CaiB-like acyl-CoA transferase
LGELKSYALSQKPEHQQELKAAIKQKIAERSLAEWQEVFAEVDACVEPVLTIEEAAEHPQLKARGMVVEGDRGDGVRQRQFASVIR